MDKWSGRANERTIKDATVKRFHYETHHQLRTHLADFLDAYNFARRFKTLSGLTPYEYIRSIWTTELDRFILDPIQQMPGLNTYDSCGRLGIEKDADIDDSMCEASAAALNTKTIVLGQDVRSSSKPLAICVVHGPMVQGCDVLDLRCSD